MTNNGNGEPDVVTALEVSDFLKIPLSTLYGLTKQGRIKGVKIGKHWRYLRSDILAYLHGKHSPSVSVPARRPSERRSYPRINCEIPAEFQITLSRKPVVTRGMLFSLSEIGAYFQDGPATAAMQAGDPVIVVFEVNQHKIRAEGRVIHIARGIGVKFKNLTSEEREVIREYVG